MPIISGSSTTSRTDGWTAAPDTWTYASASTFTIAGVDRTTIYTPGTYLKFTQTTVKYAVVVSSSFAANTTVTIAVNTDYTLANAAITSPFYSYQSNPAGYPVWFTFAPAATGFSGSPTVTAARFAAVGRVCTVFLDVSGTSNATTKAVTLPVTPAFPGNIAYPGGFAQDNGVTLTSACRFGTASGATLSIFKDLAGTAWTNTGTTFYIGTFSYEF